MSKITTYFAAEKYIGRRFLLLVSGSVLVLIPAALAFNNGLLSPRALGLVMIAYTACVAVAIFVILRNAKVRFRATSVDSTDITDGATRMKFRKRIRRLRLGVAFFALVLLNGLWETRGGPWPPVPIYTDEFVQLTLELRSSQNSVGPTGRCPELYAVYNDGSGSTRFEAILPDGYGALVRNATDEPNLYISGYSDELPAEFKDYMRV